MYLLDTVVISELRKRQPIKSATNHGCFCRSGFSREFKGVAAEAAPTARHIKRVHLQFLLPLAAEQTK